MCGRVRERRTLRRLPSIFSCALSVAETSASAANSLVTLATPERSGSRELGIEVNTGAGDKETCIFNRDCRLLRLARRDPASSSSASPSLLAVEVC